MHGGALVDQGSAGASPLPTIDGSRTFADRRDRSPVSTHAPLRRGFVVVADMPE